MQSFPGPAGLAWNTAWLLQVGGRDRTISSSLCFVEKLREPGSGSAWPGSGRDDCDIIC